MSLLITSQNAPGSHKIAFTISGMDVSMILMSVIIIVVSWIMREGVELEQEQRLTV